MDYFAPSSGPFGGAAAMPAKEELVPLATKDNRTLPPSGEEEETDISTFCEACARGDVEVVQARLLEDGTLVQQADASGYFALHWAALYNRPEVIVLLLDQGADPMARGAHGDSALHWATKKSSERALDLLLRHLQTVPDPRTSTQADVASFLPEETEESSQSPWFLLEQDDAGLAPIHHAAECGNTVAMHYFFCLGQDVNARDKQKK